MNWKNAAMGAALMAASASLAGAQSKVTPFFGAGVIAPVGEFGDFANVGWMAVGGIGIPLNNPAWAVNASLFYGRAGHDGGLDEATGIPGAGLEISYSTSLSPRVVGGVGLGGGFLQHRYSAGNSGAADESESKAFGAISTGIAVPFKTSAWWVDARLIAADGTSFFALSTGLVFNIPAPSRFRVPLR